MPRLVGQRRHEGHLLGHVADHALDRDHATLAVGQEPIAVLDLDLPAVPTDPSLDATRGDRRGGRLVERGPLVGVQEGSQGGRIIEQLLGVVPGQRRDGRAEVGEPGHGKEVDAEDEVGHVLGEQADLIADLSQLGDVAGQRQHVGDRAIGGQLGRQPHQQLAPAVEAEREIDVGLLARHARPRRGPGLLGHFADPLAQRLPAARRHLGRHRIEGTRVIRGEHRGAEIAQEERARGEIVETEGEDPVVGGDGHQRAIEGVRVGVHHRVEADDPRAHVGLVRRADGSVEGIEPDRFRRLLPHDPGRSRLDL